MTDNDIHYRHAWALNAVAMTMGSQQREKFTALDAETIWDVSRLLDEHAAITDTQHAQVRHPAMSRDAMVPEQDSPAIRAVTVALDKAA